MGLLDREDLQVQVEDLEKEDLMVQLGQVDLGAPLDLLVKQENLDHLDL